MIKKAYLITGYQGFDESVKMYLVFGTADFVSLQLQWRFHRKKAVTITLATVALRNMLQAKGRLLYTDENALHRNN